MRIAQIGLIPVQNNERRLPIFHQIERVKIEVQNPWSNRLLRPVGEEPIEARLQPA